MIPIAVMGYCGYCALRPPSHQPSHYKQVGRPQEGVVVACIGDSITHGHFGPSWVNLLRADMNQTHHFINAGHNGDCAWNIDQRLEETLELSPDVAVLLIGTNDCMGSFNLEDAQQYKQNNPLPQLPTREWYQENLRSVLTRMTKKIPRVGVATLPPLGEQRNDAANNFLALFNDDIRTIAAETGATVLDLNARLWTTIESHRKGSLDPLAVFVSGKIKLVQIFSGVFYHYVRGQTWDTVGEAYGLVTLYDRIHFTDRGVKAMADLVKEFVLSR